MYVLSLAVHQHNLLLLPFIVWLRVLLEHSMSATTGIGMFMING